MDFLDVPITMEARPFFLGLELQGHGEGCEMRAVAISHPQATPMRALSTWCVCIASMHALASVPTLTHFPRLGAELSNSASTFKLGAAESGRQTTHCEVFKLWSDSDQGFFWVLRFLFKVLFYKTLNPGPDGFSPGCLFLMLHWLGALCVHPVVPACQPLDC